MPAICIVLYVGTQVLVNGGYTTRMYVCIYLVPTYNDYYCSITIQYLLAVVTVILILIMCSTVVNLRVLCSLQHDDKFITQYIAILTRTMNMNVIVRTTSVFLGRFYLYLLRYQRSTYQAKGCNIVIHTKKLDESVVVRTYY